ncbi:catalase family protein [Oecophyllibacter saccharovorans]|uniref:Catalase n=1 Tax=Oecophyllibacter saccharovorans TaxID=2558360 RepID=A0A506UKK1_9PROT|nr:catalase family protein [Oecophyllibacter saccharovorans]TPW33848.1 catalase [Oecophyllibacter saccharovorans]
MIQSLPETARTLSRLRPPVPYSDTVEQIQPDETRINQGLEKQLRHIITTVDRDYDEAFRGVHAKSHALLKGTFTVHDGLPAELAQGLFSRPGSYRADLRISSVIGDPLCDAVSVPHGFAVKVNDVPPDLGGGLLPENDGVPVQDFLFASGLAFATPSMEEFLKLFTLLSLTTDRFLFLKIVLSRVLRRVSALAERFNIALPGMVGALGGFLPFNPLAGRYGSQAAIRYGAYMAKLDIVPESENFRNLATDLINVDYDPDAIRHHLWKIFQHEGGSWTLRAQLCRDLAENPIENAAQSWPEKNNPYLPIATIRVDPQDSWSMDRAVPMEEELAYSPWHGLKAHRPLGVVQRTRRVVYPFSARLRGRLDHCPVFAAIPRRKTD